MFYQRVTLKSTSILRALISGNLKIFDAIWMLRLGIVTNPNRDAARIGVYQGVKRTTKNTWEDGCFECVMH
jgi:hypothetical protein